MFICLKEKGCTASQGVRQAFSRAVEDRLVIAFQSSLVVTPQEALLPWGFTHPTRDSHLEGSAPCVSWNPCLSARSATAWYLWLESQLLFPPIYRCRLFRDVVVGEEHSFSSRAASFKLIHLVPAVFVLNMVGERAGGLNPTSWSHLSPSVGVALELDLASSSSFSQPPCCCKGTVDYIQIPCKDLFGLGGFHKFWRVEEVMKEVLHTLQALLIRDRFPVSLLSHLR